MCQYKSINGNTSVPRSYVTKKGVKLSIWVSIQRWNKNQSLKIKLIVRPYIIDWNLITNKWENNFELLCLYKPINGNTSVPRSHVTKNQVKLGVWVNRTRTRQDRMYTT